MQKVRTPPWLFIAPVIFLSLVSWLAYKYFHHPEIKDTGGNVVEDVPAAELGDFASDHKFKEVMDNYLRYLPLYRKLDMIGIAPEDGVVAISEKLSPALKNALRNGPYANPTSQSQPDNVLDSYARHIGTLLYRCSGPPCAKYLDAIGPDLSFHFPKNKELLDYILRTYAPGLAMPPNDADQASLRLFFERMYDVGEAFRSGTTVVTGWAIPPQGLVAQLAELPNDGQYANPLVQRMSRQDQFFFFGSLSSGCLIFTGPRDGPAATEPAVALRAECVVIIETKGRDRYPIAFQSVYDPRHAMWWLLYANRQASPRMGTSPQLVF